MLLLLGEGVAPFFLEPFGQGIATDFEGTGNTPHGSAFLINGKNRFFNVFGTAS